MPNNTDAWVVRGREVLAQGSRGAQAIPFAVSMLTAIYGPKSLQLHAFQAHLEQIAKSASNALTTSSYQRGAALGVIQNTVAEIEGGLISSLRARVAGEVLSELVVLGKEILADDTESAKNVSAVLIAAAFEDLIRRMGSELAGVVGRPHLSEVVTTLKDADILRGGEIGLAQSYLKLRNDSLHADWSKVQKSQIESCIAFVESLLLQHFR